MVPVIVTVPFEIASQIIIQFCYGVFFASHKVSAGKRMLIGDQLFYQLRKKDQKLLCDDFSAKWVQMATIMRVVRN